MITTVLAERTVEAMPAKLKPWEDRKRSPMPALVVSGLADACQRETHGDRAISNGCCGMPIGKTKAVFANEDLIEPLTPREVEILEAICEGDSNQDIARKYNIKMPTVKYHVFQIFGKLGVQRRTQAVAVSIYLGLVIPKWLLRET
jgi:DNA-binding NarL/FixJ family response regulator